MKDKLWFKQVVNFLVFLGGVVCITLCILIFVYDSEDGQTTLSMSEFELLLIQIPYMAKLVLMGVLFAISVAIFSTFSAKIKGKN